MIRNKEILRLAIVLSITGMAGVAVISYIHIGAGLLALILFGMVSGIFIRFTQKRYRNLKELSEYLASVYAGCRHMDIRDNEEGELSILKNDIYKVTLTLSEQSELLRKDKNYLSETLSNISHQLKTPLTSMFVMTDLLNDPNLPQEKKEEFLCNITNQLKRIEWLVSSLLKLSKIEAKTITFKKEPCNVRQLIEKALQPLLIPMEIKEQQLDLDCREDICITADFNWTTEAVLNILKNCMEHTQTGGTIGITCNRNSLYTELIITDNGEGIANEDKPHIFERFYKGKNAGPDSIGIGLAMSKTILNSQNATIEAESEQGAGTRFRVRFYRQIV